MERRIKLGNITWAEGQQSAPFRVTTADALKMLVISITMVLDVTVAATLRELGGLNICKQITVNRGGKTIKRYGLNGQVASAGKELYLMSQKMFGYVTPYAAPAVGVAANAFSMTFNIPFSVPDLLLKNAAAGAGDLCALQPSEKAVDLYIDFGAVADVISAGTATLTTPVIEVIAVVDPALNVLRTAKVNGNPLPLGIFAEHAKQLGIASGAGANPSFIDTIDPIGELLHVGIIGWSTNVLTDTIYNTLELLKNGTDRIVSGSWAAHQAQAKADAGLQAATFPTGACWLPVDGGYKGQGLDMSDRSLVQSVNIVVDHDATAATNVLQACQKNVIPQD